MNGKHLMIITTAVAALSVAPLEHAQARGHEKGHDGGGGPPQDALSAPTSCSPDLCGGVDEQCVQDGTCIAFANYCWNVKDSGQTKVGPGHNLFSKDNAFVDAQCKLHLKITQVSPNNWACAEVINQQSLGYGKYEVTYDTPVNNFHRNVVLALFTWSDGAAQHHREIDIEFSKWGNQNPTYNAQFVVQPYQQSSRLHPWRVCGDTPSSHSFLWAPGSVTFDSSAECPPAPGAAPLTPWEYRASSVPTPGDENARMNLWIFQGVTPPDFAPVEVVVSNFTFTR